MRKVYPLLFFVLVVVLAFWKVIFHSEFTLLNGGDLSSAYYPWFDVAAHWLKRGVLLLWDPYVYSGKANMGEPQPGLFYPLNWLFMVLPARAGGINLDGMQALLLLDYLLAGYFCYLLARSFHLTPHGAAVSGIAFSLAGFVPQLYGYVNILGGFIWMPLVLLCFRKSLDSSGTRARLRSVALSGLFLALSFLPGHHIPPVQAGLLLFFYSAYRIIANWRTADWRSRLRTAECLLGVALTGALLTAQQWIPAIEWARQVYRWIGEAPPVAWGEKVPYSALQVAGNLHPQDVLSLVFPYLTTNNNLYTGAILIFLALLGILYARRKEAVFFGISAFLYLFLSWGQFSALHGWVNTFVPGVWFAREVFHYLTPFQLCLAMLAGLGFDRLLETYSTDARPEVRIFVRKAGWMMAVLVLVSGVMIGVLYIGQELPIEHPYLRGSAALATYITVLGVLLFMLHSGRARPEAFRVLLIAAIVLDLSSAISNDIPMKNPPPGKENYYVRNVWKKPRSAEFLVRKRESPDEYFRVDDMLGIYPPNFGDAWRLDSTMGHGATALVDYFRLRGTGWDPGSNASALLNARYFLSKIPVFGMPRVMEESDMLYENPRAVPRAYLAPRYRSFADDASLLEFLSTPFLNPRETVLLFDRDMQSLPKDMRERFKSDDVGMETRIESLVHAAEDRARRIDDAEERRLALNFKPPWGWTTDDGIIFTARSHGTPSPGLLSINYYPTRSDPSWLILNRTGPAGDASMPVVLPGLDENERPFGSLHHVCADLGLAGREEIQIRLTRTEDCSALLDSLTVTRTCGRTNPGTVDIKLYEPNRITLGAEVKEPSFLVLSDVYYSGWEARVDGVEAPLFRGNFLLRAVPVLPGKHVVELRFRSVTLLWGAVIGILSLLSLILVLFVTMPTARDRTNA